jgi:hypothetical protein
MATLNPDFVLQMSAFGSDFYYDGAHYRTLWTNVRGPVRERRNYKQDWILVDLWLDDEDAAVNTAPSVDVGSDAWNAALKETAFDALFGERIRIGELGAFQFNDQYHPEKPFEYIQEDLFFALAMMDVNVEGEVPMQSRLKFHNKLMTTLMAYEYYREKQLRESIFFYHWSRDCDLCESEGIQVFDDWYTASQWIQGFHDWAEGPQSLHQVTYEQWRTFNAEPVRDRALEQFEEYGYGH